jgi:hypothetical protein
MIGRFLYASDAHLIKDGGGTALQSAAEDNR